MAAGYSCPVAPGQGSVRGEDPGKVQLPVVRAAGPSVAFGDRAWIDESDRPVAEIVDAVQHPRI